MSKRFAGASVVAVLVAAALITVSATGRPASGVQTDDADISGGVVIVQAADADISGVVTAPTAPRRASGSSPRPLPCRRSSSRAW